MVNRYILKTFQTFVHRLTLNDKRTVSKALDELDAEMALYSDGLYPSRVAVVVLPFLFEILVLENMLLKEELLDTLHYLLENSVQYLKDDTNSQFSQHLNKFISALVIHVPTLKNLKDNSSEGVQSITAKILAHYEDDILRQFMAEHK